MLTVEEEALLHIERIYDAALDQQGWPCLLNALAEAMHGNGAMLRHINTGTRQIAFYKTLGYDSRYVKAYREYFSKIDPYQKDYEKAPVGQLLNPDLVLGRNVRRASEYFNEFDLPQDKIHVIGAVLLRDERGDLQLGIQRGEDAGAYNSRDLQLLNLLIPHLARAVKMHHVLSAANYQQSLAHAALDYLRIGVLLFNAQAQLTYHNQMAEQLFEQGAISIHKQKIVLSNNKENSRLQAMLMAAIDKREGGDMGCGTKEAPLQKSLQLWIAPLPQATWCEDGGAVIFIAHCGPVQLPWMRVAKHYGLTPAEAKLAVALVNGKTLEEVASSMNLSYQTVRGQIRSVFAKTGVRRQSELMLLLLQGVLATCQDPAL